jgi:hypothetical protein
MGRYMLDGNSYESLCCWVELTKCYYICVRESRNLASQGVAGVRAPNFRLKEVQTSLPPPRPPDDAIDAGELAVGTCRFFPPRHRHATRMSYLVDIACHVIDSRFGPWCFSLMASYDVASNICQAHCTPRHPATSSTCINPRV